MGMPTRSGKSLIADIGGTNSRVASSQSGKLDRSSIRRYHNRNFSGLEALLAEHVRQSGTASYDSACFAVAGPVQNGNARVTNLGWKLNADTLESALQGARVSLINDLEALGYSLQGLNDEMMSMLVKGSTIAADRSRMVVNSGTGFNAALVVQASGGTVVYPSECGHSGLPARNQEEFAFCSYIGRDSGFASIEDALSGRGVESIYTWLASDESGSEHKRATEITEAFGKCGIADRTGRFLVGVLGSVVGNLALTHLPYGGIYLFGSVAVALSPHFQRFGFAAAFRDKGRYHPFMSNFTVRLIEDDYATLIGCAEVVSRRTATGTM